MNLGTLILSYPVESGLIIGLIGCLLVSIFVSFRRDKQPPALSPEDEAAVQNYLRENPAPALLVNNGEVVPLYALDDRFMRKVSKIEINGLLYTVKPEWKPELQGVRSSGYFLKCTAHDTPALLLSKDALRELKRLQNLVIYCFMEVDFSDEKA